MQVLSTSSLAENNGTRRNLFKCPITVNRISSPSLASATSSVYLSNAQFNIHRLTSSRMNPLTRNTSSLSKPFNRLSNSVFETGVYGCFILDSAGISTKGCMLSADLFYLNPIIFNHTPKLYENFINHLPFSIIPLHFYFTPHPFKGRTKSISSVFNDSWISFRVANNSF
jgi:hypothetical protein